MAGGHAADAAHAVDERELTSAEAYDDGFTPRSCPTAGRLLRQPASPTLPAGMTVMQGAVDPALALEAYEFTAALGQPWGTYLTSHGDSAPGELALQRIGAEPEVESLAARLLASPSPCTNDTGAAHASVSSCSFALSIPALMCVSPVHGYCGVPYASISVSIELRFELMSSVVVATLLNSTTAALEWSASMFSCERIELPNVRTSASLPPIEPLRSSTNASAIR